MTAVLTLPPVATGDLPAAPLRHPLPTSIPRDRLTKPFAGFGAHLRRTRGHGLWIAAWSLVGWIGTALAPALAHHTFLLMMLSPRALFVAMAATSAPLLPFVVLGTIRLGITDCSYFAIGKRLPLAAGVERTQHVGPPWRRRLARIAHRGDRLCRRLVTRPGLAGAFLFFRPTGKYLALAGAYGVRGVVAAAASAGGTAVFLVAMHVGFGAIF